VWSRVQGKGIEEKGREGRGGNHTVLMFISMKGKRRDETRSEETRREEKGRGVKGREEEGG
jgi:hypothetical protein